MAPFYPYFPSSTAPRAPIATAGFDFPRPSNITDATHNGTYYDHSGTCVSCEHIHPSSVPCAQCDCGHRGGDGLPGPSNGTTNSVNLTAPAPLGCDGCEGPILPDLPPASPVGTNTAHAHQPCLNMTLSIANSRFQVHNVTLTGLPELSQAQESGPGYHSKQTGQVLMVVVFVAGAAVGLGVLFCVGIACWKLKKKRAEQQRVVTV